MAGNVGMHARGHEQAWPEQAELERGHELVNYVLEGVEVGEVAAEEEEEEKEEKKGSDERNSRQWWSFESVEVKVKLEVE